MDIFTKLYFKKPPPSHVPSSSGVHGGMGAAIGKKLLHFTDIDMFYRLRPHVHNLVAVLVRPTGEENDVKDYLGPEWKKGYYFPSELFYQTLSNPETSILHDPETGAMILKRHSIQTPLFVYHLLGDGSIVQETAELFARGQAFLHQDHSWITITGSREFILSSLLHNLSERDIFLLISKIRNDMSVLLSALYTEKLDTDKIAATIESAIHDRIMAKDGTVRDYLASIFQVMLLIDPRYQFSDKLFPGNKQRIDRFFYRLEAMGDIPISFLYPEYEMLTPAQKKAMDSYLLSNTQSFISRSILHLFRVVYPYLRIPTTQSLIHVVPPPFSIPLPDVNTDMTLQIYYEGEMINLKTVAAAILTGDDDELVVNGKTIDHSFLEQIEAIFDLRRCVAGTTAFLLPTGFEMMREREEVTAAMSTTTTTTTTTEKMDVVENKNDFIEQENLIHFKKHAMDFMHTLLLSN